jgi:hypothetical protein
MKNIQLLRLTSGEEIIGNVADKDDSWRVEDAIVMIPAGEGKLGFMPWMPYTKSSEGVDIPKQHVMFVVEPIDDLKNQHQQATSSIDLSASSAGKGIIT